ncbi:MAG: EamA family transporter [Myxococcota bacterium]|nr:EamA family transporter [Myxococcota bacterium]
MTATAQRSAGDWARLLGLVVIWGTAFLFIDLSVETIPPATLVTARVGIAAIVLLIAVRFRGLALPGPGALWLRFLLLACVGNAIPFFAISWGQQRVSSGLAGILMAVMPLTTLLLAHFFLPGQHMTRRRTTGFVMGFAGVVVLTGPDTLSLLGGAQSDIVFQLAVLMGALCYATNSILAERMVTTQPLVSAACVMLMASLVILPVSLWVDRPWQLAPSPLSLVSVVWLGLVPTGAATVLYFRIVSSAGSTFLSLMNYLIPGVALATGIVLGGESFEWHILAALALILAGLFTSQTVATKA